MYICIYLMYICIYLMYFDVLLYVMYLMYRLVHHKLAGRSKCFQGLAKKPSRGEESTGDCSTSFHKNHAMSNPARQRPCPHTPPS